MKNSQIQKLTTPWTKEDGQLLGYTRKSDNTKDKRKQTAPWTAHRSIRKKKDNTSVKTRKKTTEEYRKKMITPWTKEKQTNRGQQKNRKKT